MSIEEEKDDGQRAALSYFNRYGQEAVILRASELTARRGGLKGPIYALGFFTKAYELAGFTSEEIDE